MAPSRSPPACPTSRSERFALGRGLRQEVPRSALGAWSAPADRPDPVELVRRSHEGRLEELVPIRVARMMTSPYGFLRGTAIVMAHDVAGLVQPVVGLVDGHVAQQDRSDPAVDPARAVQELGLGRRGPLLPAAGQGQCCRERHYDGAATTDQERHDGLVPAPAAGLASGHLAGS